MLMTPYFSHHKELSEDASSERNKYVGLSDYEQLRAENIKRNNIRLKKLGLLKPEEKKKKKKKTPKTETNKPVRQSTRLVSRTHQYI